MPARLRAEAAAQAALQRDDEEDSYENEESVLKAIEQGLLMRGVLRVDRHHTNEAIIRAHTSEGVQNVLITSRLGRSNAIHGDEVAVQLLLEESWEHRRISGRGDILSAALEVCVDWWRV